MNKMNKKLKVHFMGIGGSGISAVAQLAHHQGYEVSGCDLQTNTPYIEKVRKDGITIITGHDSNHLQNIDLLAASPAAFFQKPLHPELAQAVKLKKAITWQKFLGDYLHRDKTVICVSGTHGKSSTTAMASLTFEDAGLDPSVMIGATVPRWNNNARLGGNKLFITESDEFFDNFLNYHPDTIILNNIELDHPDYFKTEKQLFQSFKKHLENLTGDRNLIFNQDSPGIKKLFDEFPEILKKTNLIGYTLNDSPLIVTPNSFVAENILHGPAGTDFDVSNSSIESKDASFHLNVPGAFNISNALGVIALGLLFDISLQEIRESLSSFSGIGRRLELIGQPRGITVYDDYGHHPTAIKATLQALKERHPEAKVFAIVEPHSYSRTQQLLSWYRGAFADADEVIIAPIFQARDTETFGITEESIVEVAGHPKIQAIHDFDSIVTYVKSHAKKKDIIVVFGAGKSYYLTRQIVTALTTA